MSDKNKTLILVEGDHEKNYLLKMILKVFPEIPIKLNDVYIFEADIYDLYSEIVEEYGEDWDSDEINIPMLISRRQNVEISLDNRLITNIFIIFDFERHDPSYSDEKIKRLQKHFSNSTEDGALFINYPMIEAYQHITGIPDDMFIERMISTDIKSGSNYKNLVHKASQIWEYMRLYEKCIKTMTRKVPVISDEKATEMTDMILSIDDKENLMPKIQEFLERELDDSDVVVQLTHYYNNAILKAGYIENNVDFWTTLRKLFLYTSDMMLLKAFVIQGNSACPDNLTQDIYYAVDLLKVLETQIDSANKRKEIRVLATCLMFMAEYKFYWNRK